MSQHDKLIPLSEDDLMPVSGGSGVSVSNIQNMSLEDALMAVPSDRASRLDQQVAEQASQLDNRNKTVSGLNNAVNTFEAIGAALTGDQAATTATKVPGKEDTLGTAIQTLTNLGIETSKLAKFAEGGFSKSELAELASITREQASKQGDSMQMDMLRLQSMSNMRNEAFDLMTNFIKKMQDSRSSIIGNMR